MWSKPIKYSIAEFLKCIEHICVHWKKISFDSIIAQNTLDKTPLLKHFPFYWHCLLITKILLQRMTKKCMSVVSMKGMTSTHVCLNVNLISNRNEFLDKSKSSDFSMFTVCYTLLLLFSVYRFLSFSRLKECTNLLKHNKICEVFTITQLSIGMRWWHTCVY